MQRRPIRDSSTTDAVSPRELFADAARIALPLIALIALVAVMVYLTGVRAERKILEAEEERTVVLQKKSIAAELDSIVADLAYLSRLPALEAMLVADHSKPSPAHKTLERNFAEFAAARRIYDQIRVLDAAGREIVRISAGEEGTRIVPPAELQEKSDRYYFKEAVTLRAGEFYVSPLDLNIERNRIEIPFKPMMRFATPVFDSTGSVRAVVVLNYHAGRLIRNFVELGRSEVTGAQSMLVNSDGYWLRSPVAEDEWGFLFQDRGNRRFDRTFPEAWRQIRAREEGAIETPNGLFTYATIYPVRVGLRSGHLSVSGEAIREAGYEWKIISRLPPSSLYAKRNIQRRRLFVFLIAMVAIVSVSSGWIAFGRSVRRRAREALRESEERYRTLIENVNVGVYRRSCGSGSRFIQVNPAMAAIFEYNSVEELMCVTPAELFANPDDRDDNPLFETFDPLCSHITNEDRRMRKITGRPFWAARTATVKRDDNGRPLWIDGVLEDITSRKLTEEQLVHLATHDPLTGLPNRMLFEDRLAVALHSAERHDNRLAILMLDLNGFKLVNDRFGHHAGDQLLEIVAERLQTALRKTDTVARVGGDEFVILLPNLNTPPGAVVVAEKCVTMIAEPIRIAGRDISITAAVGIAMFPQDGTDGQTLLRRADAAMYAAKREGNGYLKRFSSELEVAVEE